MSWSTEPEGPPALWVPLLGLGHAGPPPQHSAPCLPLCSEPPSRMHPHPAPNGASSLVIPLAGPLNLSPGIPDADQFLQASSAFHLQEGTEVLSSRQAWRFRGPQGLLLHESLL